MSTYYDRERNLACQTDDPFLGLIISSPVLESYLPQLAYVLFCSPLCLACFLMQAYVILMKLLCVVSGVVPI